MNINVSQIGNTPSEPLCENDKNEHNIQQLISAKIVSTSQPLIPLTTTNMIPSSRQYIHDVPVYDNITRRQQSRRRRRQRQLQRRREQRETVRRPQEQQQQQQSIHRQIRERRYEQYQERLWKRQKEHERFNDIWEHSDPLQETMGEEFIEIQLEAYHLETMDPKYRWEQEQLNQINAVLQLQEEEQQRKNSEELIQFEQWEQIALLVQ